MGKTVLKTKQGIINALRKDAKILQIYFSSVYWVWIDYCKKKVGVNEFKSLLEAYHNKIASSDYLYSAIKSCINENLITSERIWEDMVKSIVLIV